MTSIDVEIRFGTRHQKVDGFGFCQAFQRAASMRDMHSGDEIASLLFSRESGAGLSILRLCIGSSEDDVYPHQKSIQPFDPGGPAAPPRYVWDRDDNGQVWLAKQAQSYGVSRFYACSWSAPGYMKTNGSEINGGVLSGMPGTGPDAPDWRAAFAEYLLQYVRFYVGEGISITDLGFANEPEIARYYPTMQMDRWQAVDFAKILGRAVERSEFSLNIVCCEALGWNHQARFTAAIEADPECAGRVAIHGAHQYGDPSDGPAILARQPLPTDRPAWMTEWSPDVVGDGWTEEWDSGYSTSGIEVAQNIHDCLTLANVSAYIYWYGASIGGTRALIQMDGDRYNVSKRLWALAAFSRFIRPGAHRVAAESSHKELRASAYENTDSSKVVELLNVETAAIRVSISTDRRLTEHVISSYLTDSHHSLAKCDRTYAEGDHIVADVAPRSILTVTLAGEIT